MDLYLIRADLKDRQAYVACVENEILEVLPRHHIVLGRSTGRDNFLVRGLGRIEPFQSKEETEQARKRIADAFLWQVPIDVRFATMEDKIGDLFDLSIVSLNDVNFFREKLKDDRSLD